jgi:hypothetical protein
MTRVENPDGGGRATEVRYRQRHLRGGGVWSPAPHGQVADPGPVFELSGLAPVQRWSLAARLAVRNLLVAGPPAAVPVAGLAILAGRDPAVLLLGLPVFLLHALKLIAAPGLRRAGWNRPL